MATLYETDFHAWTLEQAEKARRLAAERSNIDLDLLNIAEELDDMGRSNRQQLTHRLAGIYEHLLKLAFSLNSEPRRQWELSVKAQRASIARLIRKYPSLKHHVQEDADDGYEIALAIFDDTLLIQLNMDPLPDTAPFDLHEQALNPDWWPEPRAGH